jgi:hypothetical protein
MGTSLRDEKYYQVEELLPTRIKALFAMVEQVIDEDSDDVIAAFVLHKMRDAVVASRIEELGGGEPGIDYSALEAELVGIYASLEALKDIFEAIDDPTFKVEDYL